jgi:transcriptional regulator with XRE-family HTH domain
MRLQRRAAGLTGKELGALVGVPQSRISMIETGRALPTPRVARGLALVLHLDPKELSTQAVTRSGAYASAP